MALKRISKEISLIRSECPLEEFRSVRQVGDDKFHYEVRIAGPEDTPYHGGVFVFDYIYPQDYPFKPPRMRATTKIYHCNIDQNGAMCQDILQGEWSPALNIIKVFTEVVSVLSLPYPDSPLDPEKAQLYKKNRSVYEANAR